MAAARRRETASAKHLDVSTLNDHLPDAARRAGRSPRIAVGAKRSLEALRDGSRLDHGLQRVQDGFDIVEVVAEYNILRGCVHDLAEANGFSLQGQAFHILNRVLDGAIGYAVESFATTRAAKCSIAAKSTSPSSPTICARRSTPCRSAARVLDQTIRPGRQRRKHAHGQVAAPQRAAARSAGRQGVGGEHQPGNRSRHQARAPLFDLWPLVEALVHDINPVAGTAARS